jgi:hypothetical protein
VEQEAAGAPGIVLREAGGVPELATQQAAGAHALVLHGAQEGSRRLRLWARAWTWLLRLFRAKGQRR